jgi:hypothetical protein
MSDTLDTREVVEEIRKKLEDAVYDHNLELLADLYTVLVLRDTSEYLTAYKDYFILMEGY